MCRTTCSWCRINPHEGRVLSAENTSAAHAHTFPEVEAGASTGEMHLTLDDLMAVRMEVAAELGSTTLLVRDVLNLHVGSVLPLDKNAGEMTDVYLNELPIARGEVVVIGDNITIRLAEVGGVSERIDLGEGEESGDA